MYRQFSQQGYGKRLGEQMMATAQLMQANHAGLIFESNTLQYVLNGDPMVRINYHDKPEIELRAEFVDFKPEKIDLSTDSITVSIKIRNLGKAFNDTIQVQVIRDFPSSNTDSIYFRTIYGLNYEKTILVKMPLQANIGSGLNRISIKVDIPSFVQEQYDEFQNNQLTKNLVIDIDGIVPVSPFEFAVVPEDSVTVRASTINPVASMNTYIFEIDTTDLFTSSFKRFAVVSGTGGIVEVNPSTWKLSSNSQTSPLICTDSTVYFWRVAINAPTPEWIETSFQYITGKSGWGQDHFFQLKNNTFTGIDYERTNRLLNFSPDSNLFELKAEGIGGDYLTGNDLIWDQQLQEYGNTVSNSVKFSFLFLTLLLSNSGEPEITTLCYLIIFMAILTTQTLTQDA